MSSRRSGFSVIELLIVVAIVLIICAIAIPNLLRSRVASNEASAVGSLRTIMSAEAAYKAMYGIGYTNNLATLDGTGENASCTSALLIDGSLGAGEKSGYRFTFNEGAAEFQPQSPVPQGCVLGKSDGYAIQADPVTIGTTGQRHFCADASGVIRFDTQKQIAVAPPTCSSSATPLQ
jgi:type IV pilus assembly protein PilA